MSCFQLFPGTEPLLDSLALKIRPNKYFPSLRRRHSAALTEPPSPGLFRGRRRTVRPEFTLILAPD